MLFVIDGLPTALLVSCAYRVLYGSVTGYRAITNYSAVCSRSLIAVYTAVIRYSLGAAVLAVLRAFTTAVELHRSVRPISFISTVCMITIAQLYSLLPGCCINIKQNVHHVPASHGRCRVEQVMSTDAEQGPSKDRS